MLFTDDQAMVHISLITDHSYVPINRCLRLSKAEETELTFYTKSLATPLCHAVRVPSVGCGVLDAGCLHRSGFAAVRLLRSDKTCVDAAVAASRLKVGKDTNVLLLQILNHSTLSLCKSPRMPGAECQVLDDCTVTASPR